MTLGPAFGAPPPSDFNEPHDLHHEPAPVDPDEDHTPASNGVERGSNPPSSPASESAHGDRGKRRWFGWLRRSS